MLRSGGIGILESVKVTECVGGTVANFLKNFCDGGAELPLIGESLLAAGASLVRGARGGPEGGLCRTVICFQSQPSTRLARVDDSE